MKKLIFSTALLFIISGLWAQMTIESANIATFDLKAHTTVGYDIENNMSGMETVIDQMQIWFEIFPYSTRGVPAKESEDVMASIRVDGSKYAFKWFAKQENLPGQKKTSSDEFVSAFEFDRIIAELLYKEYWFRIAGTEPSMFTNRASLKSIFDDVIKDSGNSNVPISMLPVGQNLVAVSDMEIPMTGMLSAGANYDRLQYNVRAGSKGTWKTNTGDAWIVGGDVAFSPAEKLTFSLSSLAAMNYDESAPGTNPVAYGAGLDYLVSFTDKVALRPFVGFDGKYETVSEKATWEAGGGFFLYWKGPDYKTTHDEIHRWNKTFPVGLSLSGNIDDKKYSSVIFSLFEETGRDALIANLGGFIEVEGINLLAVEGQDSALAAAAQVEYLIQKKIKPYLFGKYAQGYESGKLTDTDKVTSRVGLIIMPVKRFSIDIRYERTDAFGTDENLDNGVVTSTFKMKL